MDIITLLRALQFGDSFLPVGAFSFSSGLESAVEQGIVHNASTLAQFVRVALEQAASADGIALLYAHRCAVARDPEGVCTADRALYNRKLNQEFRSMSVRMGKKLGELAAHVCASSLVTEWVDSIKQGQTPGTYAVGLGVVAAAVGLQARDAFALHQYGVATMITGASLRLMKITHLETQAILFEENRAAQTAYERIANATLQDMSSFAPYLDILAAIHVPSNVRMFMN